MDKCADPLLYIEELLDSRIREFLSSPCSVNFSLKLNKRHGRKTTCADFVIPAFTRRLEKSPEHQGKVDFLSIADKLLGDDSCSKRASSIKTYFNKLDLNSGHLTITLNRKAVTKAIIGNVLNRSKQYGSGQGLQKSCQNCGIVVVTDTVLQHSTEARCVSLEDLRTVTTAMHVSQLLKLHGVGTDAVHVAPPQSSMKSSKGVPELLPLFSSFYSENQQDDLPTLKDIVGKIRPRLESLPRVVPITLENSPLPAYEDENCSNHADGKSSQHQNIPCSSEAFVINVEQCLKDRRITGFSSTVTNSKAVTSDNLLQHISCLELGTAKSTQAKGTIIHVINCRKLFASQTGGLLWQITSDNPCSSMQVFISLGLVSAQKNGQILPEDISAETLLRIREKQLHESYFLKYGSQVTGEEWVQSIRSMAISTIKIQLMAAAQNSNITLDISENSQDFRQATFLLYNSARLSKLFQKFEDGVTQGLYPSLPSIDQVDFSLLRDEEPRPHLFPLMFARLYLIKAIQQVLHNCLALLEIEPLTQM
ncbi:DALR anticodon-binding domain-containing protein 3 isoform X2 [Nematostella vectensis]|uniref:DALR anticodon-binding domain-containing protein 3 isoform X2 n=1 Tax=Nematostella vectensis TaxID=45351 RepID=UPI0020779A1C|nr:DALR anticodon-binding domain-containing protein 3 isoform X2 [Nematostella vectensis]